MKPAISILGLTKAFGKKLAVDNVNLEIPPGVVYGLLGPNGAGKTTLVRMLSTIIRPTSGTALVNGFDISGEAEKVRLSIGVLPEETVVVEDNGQSLLNHISFETQRI
jgi:ABC-2 type transport system ATP-binding protein